MYRMPLSNDFHLDEFTRSQVAKRHGIVITVHPPVFVRLVRLCNNILQPLRNHIHRPVHIDSGYRPPKVNALVGGSEHSQHQDGGAADIIAPAYGSPLVIARTIIQMGLPFDQLIYEFQTWVHISDCGAGKTPRGSVLTSVYRNGKVEYLPGLVE